MNVLHPGKVRTSCKDCVFAIYDEDGTTQVGCRFERLDTFKEQGKLIEAFDEKWKFFVVNGFCNRNRGRTWAYNKLDPMEVVRRETSVSLGLVIFDRRESNIPVETLTGTLDSLDAIDYPHNRIKVILATSTHRDRTYLMNKVDQLRAAGFQAETVISLVDDKAMIEHDVFRRCIGATHFGRMVADSMIWPQTLNIVDNSVNEKLEKIVLFENITGLSILPFGVVNSEYTKYMDFDLMVDKIRPLAMTNKLYGVL